MKMGMVTAHEEIDKFAEFLANRFSTAFDTASKGLNSSFGRLSTASNELYAAVYTNISSTLITGLNKATEALNSFKKATEDVYAFYRTATTIVTSGVLIVITALLVKLRTVLAGVAVAASANPLGATLAIIGVAVAYLGTRFFAATEASDKFVESLSNLKNLNLEEQVDTLDKSIDSIAKRLKAATTTGGGMPFGNLIDVGADFWAYAKDHENASYADYQKFLKTSLTEAEKLRKEVKEKLANQVKSEPAEDSSMFTMLGLTDKQVNATVNQTKVLLDKQKAEIDNAAKIATQIEKNKLDTLTFTQANIADQKLTQLNYTREEERLNNNIAKIEDERIKKQLALVAGAKEELASINAYFNLTKTPPKTDIYKAIRQRETGVTSPLDNLTGGKTNGLRGAAQVGGSLADPSKGAMQVTLAAWMDVGRQKVDFEKANLIELDKAGQEYFDKQLAKYKDLRIAFAAYNQGSGAMDAIYKKAGVKVGAEDETSLAKVRAEFTKLQRDYSDGVVTNLTREKILKKDELAIIVQEKEEEKLITAQQMNQEQLSQNIRRIDQQRLVDTQAYKNMIVATNVSYLESEGKIEEAETIKYQLAERTNILMLQAVANSKEVGASEAINVLRQKAAIQEYNVFKRESARFDAIEIAAAKELEKIQERVKVQRQLGFITVQDANNQIVAATMKVIAAEDEIIDRLTKELALHKGNLVLEEQLALAKEKRASMLTGASDAAGAITQAGQGSQFSDIKNSQNLLSNLETGKGVESKALAKDTGMTEADARLEVDKKYAAESMQVHLQLYSGIAKVGADTFMGLTQQMMKMYGAKSKQAKIAFMAYKAAKIAEITMATASAAITAYKDGLEVGGIAGPAVGAAFAAMAVVMGAVQLAQVASAPMPAAHGGLTNVPKEETYLLDKGERVLSPNQNKDLTNFMSKGNMQKESKEDKSAVATAPIPQANVKIVNVIDPSVFNDFLGTMEGEKVIMNVVRRNKDSV